MKPQVLHIYPENELDFQLIEAFCKASNIKYALADENSYDPDFVDKIQKARQDYKDGKGKVYTTEQLNDLWK